MTINQSIISKYSFSGDLISISENEFKDVSFVYSKSNYESELNQLSATVGALTIDNSTVSWNSEMEKQTSSFKGDIKISDLTETEGLLNFTSAFQRGELAASAELSWRGNPADIGRRL